MGNPKGDEEPVGIYLQFATFDAIKQIVEDHSLEPLRGCRYQSGDGKCNKGSGYCHVANVVALAQYHARIAELRKLKPLPTPR